MGMKGLIMMFLVVSSLLTGVGFTVNSMLGSYDVAGTNISSLNKTAEINAEIDSIRTDITNTDIDSTTDVVLVSFKASPKIFKSFFSFIDLFQTMLDDLTSNSGIVLSAWFIILIFGSLSLAIIFIVLSLFFGRDKINDD